MNLKRSLNMALAMSDMNQNDLAAKIKVTTTWLSMLKNQTSCTTDTLEKLSSAFGMSVSEFVALGEDG